MLVVLGVPLSSLTLSIVGMKECLFNKWTKHTDACRVSIIRYV